MTVDEIILQCHRDACLISKQGGVSPYNTFTKFCNKYQPEPVISIKQLLSEYEPSKDLTKNYPIEQGSAGCRKAKKCDEVENLVSVWQNCVRNRIASEFGTGSVELFAGGMREATVREHQRSKQAASSLLGEAEYKANQPIDTSNQKKIALIVGFSVLMAGGIFVMIKNI